jgi:hypothetical protein
VQNREYWGFFNPIHIGHILGECWADHQLNITMRAQLGNKAPQNVPLSGKPKTRIAYLLFRVAKKNKQQHQTTGNEEHTSTPCDKEKLTIQLAHFSGGRAVRAVFTFSAMHLLLHFMSTAKRS